MELSSHQIDSLLKRLPYFEVSYETVLHKNIPTNENYNVALAIPFGKKYFMWFTYYQDKNVCFLMELNRDKKIIRISILHDQQPLCLAFGTLLYVSSQTMNHFFIEDIYYYKGLPLNRTMYCDKLGYMEELLSLTKLPIYLPNQWWISANPIPKNAYPIHHIQFRCLTQNLPFLNQSKEVITNIKNTLSTIQSNPASENHKSSEEVHFRPNYKKPQYRLLTIFIVNVDIKFDIYHLYACGKNMKHEYYGVAGIPSLKISMFMNSLFRKIRENINIDYIEESEDEEDFENIREDKYILPKKLSMECEFHPKFKKWIPIKVVDSHRRIVHIHKL